MKLYTEQTEEMASYQKQIQELNEYVKFLLEHFKPVFNGEIYLSGKELCELLHISQRTLQQYRDDGFLPYIQIEGKILYKESDVLKILENNYKAM